MGSNRAQFASQSAMAEPGLKKETERLDRVSHCHVIACIVWSPLTLPGRGVQSAIMRNSRMTTGAGVGRF